MRRFLSVVAVAVLTSGLPLRAQDQPPGEVLTLDQAIALGLQQNRSIRSDRVDVQKAEDSLASIKTRRRPTFEVNFLEARLLADVNLDFPGGAFGVFPGTGPVPPTETNVTTPAQWTSTVFFRVDQPLTQLYRIGLGERQLELGRDMASERVRGREQSVTGDIRRLYYGILQTQYALTARDQSLNLHVEVERLVREYIQQGVALEADGLEVEALVAREQSEVRALRDSSASLHEQLNALMGRDITTPFTVAPVPETQLGDEGLPALEARAVANRPEVKQAALALDQAKYDVRIKHSTLYPDVSATVDFLGFYRWQVLPPAVAMAGFLATWEPFDWGRKRREVDTSQRVVEQATVATQDADALVRIDVRTSYRKLATARDMAHVAELAVGAARERLRVATMRYREQNSLFRDVLQAQAALATADEQHYDAMLQLATARAELEKAVGDR
jgi:outer membrane protein TolC